MKPFKLISTLLTLISLFSCKPQVTLTFSEPQPTATDNLLEFPKHLQGQYYSLEDSSSLLISDKIIQKIYDFDLRIHPSELDSFSYLSGDTIIDSKTNKKSLVKRDGDSLITHYHFIDTLFQINYDNVIRKLKGDYFLNTRHDKSSWVVQKMQLSKGHLVISGISTEKDIDNLNEIVEVPIDTVRPYKTTLTQKDFKEFVKKGGFSDSETFVRQNER